jgi:hypothetical protein
MPTTPTTAATMAPYTHGAGPDDDLLLDDLALLPPPLPPPLLPPPSVFVVLMVLPSPKIHVSVNAPVAFPTPSTMMTTDEPLILRSSTMGASITDFDLSQPASVFAMSTSASAICGVRQLFRIHTADAYVVPVEHVDARILVTPSGSATAKYTSADDWP